MVLTLVTVSGRFWFITPVPSCNSGGVAGALAGENQGRVVIWYLSPLHVPDDQVSFPLWRPPTFPQSSFYHQHTYTSSLVILDVPGHLQFYQGFGFPNLIPGYLDRLSAFLTANLSLFLPSVGFLLTLEFVQELLVHPSQCPGIFY